MTSTQGEKPAVRALVDLHLTEEGALWAHVQALLPTYDLGTVPLAELAVLLEALVADANAGPES